MSRFLAEKVEKKHDLEQITTATTTSTKTRTMTTSTRKRRKEDGNARLGVKQNKK